MANDHYMPWFIGDFMASTATWTGPERGLYIQLLGFQWTSGALPNEIERLAGALNYDLTEFRRLWRVVGLKFRDSNESLLNPRLEEIRARGVEIRATRAEVGRAGGLASGEARAKQKAKQTPSKEEPIASDLLPVSLKQNASKIEPSNPIHSDPDPIQEKITKSAEIPGERAAPITATPEPGDLLDAVREAKRPAKVRKPPSFDFDRADYPTVNWAAFESFVEHRQIIGKRIQPKGAKDVVALLSRFTTEQQAQMVSSARVGGWSGLYEPKGYTNGSGARPAVKIRTVAELEAEERSTQGVSDVQRTQG